MGTTTYSARWGSDTIRIRADWAQAASQVEAEGDPGEWAATGMQVAQYRHRPRSAMRDQLTRMVSTDGLDADDADRLIDVAVGAMVAE